ncbi:hypothetical protein [Desulfosporosinus metallidurans]|uniref:Nuclease SbcCD subunit C n=1 Tax=Desulfosporosinus metallidurans TaxID=1888891 RepID=A0A1Q8QIR3_9FIRM|nr:hypothetical protein [Desulfosporosinus metallidurans]OLN27214.1 DNA double-strand break repair Rad50 ATPase [Desulfosporosinus metallidurans]
MKLNDVLHRLRFGKEIKSEVFHFRNEAFEFFRVKRSEELLPSIQFSEYFFMEVSEATITKMTEEDDLGYFREFQTKLLAKSFFSHKSDLRWNLYLILVIESYELLRDSNLARKIEDDADYARKFITTPDDILILLDKEWLQTAKADNIEQLDPLQEWNQHLEPLQLTGCLTQTFASKGKERVNQYLEGQPLSEGTAPTRRGNRISDDYEEKIGTINSISFDGFRKHCFDQLKPIQPSKVNLIHGSNGSGKTSAVEAIELALTDDIRRCSEFGDLVEETANQLQVWCRTESGKTLPYQSGKPVAIYKKLAQSWYGVTPGHKSELNYYFHRFNYFDSEAAYRFALSESSNKDHQKFDYSDNLSRLVFGDSILKTQSEWQRYKDEFADQLKDLTNRRDKYSSLKTTLGEKIASLSPAQAAQPIELDKLLASIHLRESKIEHGTATALEHMESLNLLLKSVEPRRKEIIEFPLINGTLTLEQIQIQLKLNKDNLDLLMAEKESKVVDQKYLESERSRISSELAKNREKELLVQQSIDDIKRHLQEWKEVRKVLEDDQAQVQKRRRLEQKLGLLNHKLNVLQNLGARFSRLPLMKRQDLFLLPQESIQQLHGSVEEKTKLLKKSKQQLVVAENLMGELNAMISRLQHLGKDFLEKDTHAITCPLCKHDYGTHIKLAQAIQSANSVSWQGDNGLDVLRQSIEVLQVDVDLLNKQIKQQDLNKRNVEQVNEAYMVLANDPQFDVDANQKNPEEQLQTIHNLLAAQNEWKEQRNTTHDQLLVFDNTGFSNNEIIQAELFQKENKFYRQYIEQQSVDSFEAYVIARQKELQGQAIEVNQASAQLRNQNADLEQRLVKISFEELNQSIVEQEKQIGLWRNLKESIETLLLDFNFNQNDNLRAWAIQLETARMQVELLIEINKHDHEQLLLQSQLENTEDELGILQNKIQRCELACNALGQLRSLKTYTEEFITKNIAKIERFFKLLHTPREFDEIHLEEDGLILRRKWDQEECAVKAFQMSSGQRASLALSVMFAVHLAAPNAPKFIIMDEPVANMDDLHLMNLLDLLRDLALSGRQIFFTTANPDVANLFRRKFSFFEEQFTHFEFSRHSGKPVQIRSMKYSPDKENPFFSYIS